MLEIENVLNELGLKKFHNNFKKQKIIFSDLPNLDYDDLVTLFGKNVNCIKTFKKFIDSTFNENGWYIDNKMITINNSDTIDEGSFSKIKKGKLKVGIGEIDCVIKVMKLDEKNNNTKKKVIQEVKTTKILRHPNIINVFGCFFKNNIGYLVLPYFKNGNLENYLFDKTNIIKDEQKYRILIQICNAMQYISSMEYAHRDLKPQNILISDDKSKVVLCDFGFSKSVFEISNTVLGSPEYLAPEYLKTGIKKDPILCDIYSFGILMWTVWKRKKPFKKIMKKFKKNPIFFVQHISQSEEKPETKNIPEEFKRIMEWCWQSNPEERCPSFFYILDELQISYKILKSRNIKKKRPS
jgi:serine/threonine protein kinase